MSGVDDKPARRRLSADSRRQQIAEAAIACLAERSPEEWTLRQVARDIGVAPSLITYFFASWDDLLLSAYRLLAERYRADVAAIEEKGLGGRAYLEAIVDLYLGDDASRRRTAGAYIALWAFSQKEPRLRREMARFSEAALASIARALEAHARALGIERDLTGAERTLYILLDGLWYEMAVNPDYLSLADARAMAWSYIEGVLAD